MEKMEKFVLDKITAHLIDAEKNRQREYSTKPELRKRYEGIPLPLIRLIRSGLFPATIDIAGVKVWRNSDLVKFEEGLLAAAKKEATK